MTSTTAMVDELVREYLLFRGFNKAASVLETEIKFDRDKNLRADKITEHLFSFIQSFDLTGLVEYWQYLNRRFFRRIVGTATHVGVQKLETCLYRYYLINAHQSSKSDKVVEFFEKMSPDLMGKDMWKEWYCFPYVKNPETNYIFEPYFSRQWYDTFNMSLQNFLSTVLEALPLPTLLSYGKEQTAVEEIEYGNSVKQGEIQQLQKEVSNLKIALKESKSIIVEEGSIVSKTITGLSGQAGGLGRSDDMDDFYIISEIAGKSPSTGSVFAGKQGRYGEPTLTAKCKNGSFTILNYKDFTEHNTGVTSAKFSSEGMFCCSSDSDGVVKVWSFSPEIRTVHSFVFKFGVFAIHWARKVDKLLYVGTGNSKIKIVNIANRKIAQEFTHPTPNLDIFAIASNLMGNHLVTSGVTKARDDCELLVWDTKTQKVISTLDISPAPSPILSCHYNHNGNLLVTGAVDGMIRVYDMTEYQCVMGWQAHSTPIVTVMFSVDENSVFSFGEEGTLSQWRLYPMSQCISSVTGNACTGLAEGVMRGSMFALDNGGHYVLVARDDRAVIYSIKGGLKEDSCLPSQGSAVMGVDWHVPYSTRLCMTATQGGVARITGLLCS